MFKEQMNSKNCKCDGNHAFNQSIAKHRMRIFVNNKSTTLYDLYKRNIEFQVRNLMKKSKIISEQASKTAKQCIKKNSRSLSNFINCSYENWDKYQINQYSTWSEKSKIKT
jgi:hypothetical protein